jgi:hypothetical protein
MDGRSNEEIKIGGLTMNRKEEIADLIKKTVELLNGYINLAQENGLSVEISDNKYSVAKVPNRFSLSVFEKVNY